MIDRKYKCGCVIRDATIIPCHLHFEIIDTEFKVIELNEVIRKNNFTGIYEFKLHGKQLKQIIEMLEFEKEEITL